MPVFYPGAELRKRREVQKLCQEVRCDGETKNKIRGRSCQESINISGFNRVMTPPASRARGLSKCGGSSQVDLGVVRNLNDLVESDQEIFETHGSVQVAP